MIIRTKVQAWKAQGKGGVWLKLPIALSGHVPIATSLGFIFHHAEPEYVMLTRWLQDRPSPLPASASHQVGVGVLVLNDRGEMLVVKEQKGPAAKLDIWKVPTGLLDRAEDFSAAAVREVKEETVCLLHSGQLVHTCTAQVLSATVICEALKCMVAPAYWMPGAEMFQAAHMTTHTQQLRHTRPSKLHLAFAPCTNMKFVCCAGY